MGRVFVKAREMLEIIEREGMVLEAPQVDRFGNAVEVIGPDGVRDFIYEKRLHPLLDALVKLLRVMKIDLHEFMLTPMAQGVGSPSLEGGIKASQINIDELHIHQDKQTQMFVQAVAMAERMREQDPVYQQHKQLANGGPKT